MIEHPLPTPATAKLLYATAIKCGFEGCSEPLFVEDKELGVWVLNSEISHICARGEGGPRWEADQTAEENRAAGNLILMCHKHAAEIDAKHGPKKFPADLLRNWKDAQLQLHREAAIGWPLTEAAAQDILRVSFSNVGIAINADTLKIGGEGGRAPGAGGGGGGAIGPHARAGRGGPGGNIISLDGAPLSEADLAGRELFSVGGKEPPGAGGGGAPAMGPGAIGGDGGGGGDHAFGSLHVEKGDVWEVRVGAGGVAPRLPGQHGLPGEDTVITIKSPEGKIKRVIRTKGGAAAEAGRLPDDWAPISQQEVDDGFNITVLMPVDALQFREGLAFVLGGGWFKFTVPSLPCDQIFNVLVGASWRVLTPGPTRGLQLCLMDPKGREVSRIALPILPENQAQTSLMWVRGIGAALDQLGEWRLTVQSGEMLLAEHTVSVALQATPA